MKYWKYVESGYIGGIGTGRGQTEITETEYNNILSVIRSKPDDPEGYVYKLKADLTWELVEAPPVPPIEEEATIEDCQEQFNRLGVDV